MLYCQTTIIASDKDDQPQQIVRVIKLAQSCIYVLLLFTIATANENAQ